MSDRKNLNDNINPTYPFSVGGLDFDLHYPTLAELEPIQALTAEREETQDGTALKEIDKKLEDTLYSFIHPVGHEKDIRNVLNDQPFPVVKAFNKMVAEQLSVE